MVPLQHLLGGEYELGYVSRALRDCAQSHHAPVVGALHVTCSDECEREETEAFQHWFAESLLPELKFASKSPFRTANLGGRYEWGSVRIAEDHYAVAESAEALKVLVVKLNSHVAVHESGGRTAYGRIGRYGRESVFCGKLHSLLDDQGDAAIDDMKEAFESDGLFRLAMLRNPEQVDPHLRSLLAAVVSARLQARRAIIDIQDYVPVTPTLYLVAACVTLNRERQDTELVVGCYCADRRAGRGRVDYHGLGDDPTRYKVSQRHGVLFIADEHLQQPRPARDHRAEVFELWRRRRSGERLQDSGLNELARHPARRQPNDARLAREMLEAALCLAADSCPAPASILLFAKGVAGIHHLHQA